MEICLEVLHLILFICAYFPGEKQLLQTGRETQHLKLGEVIKTVVLQAGCCSADGNFPGCQEKRGRKPGRPRRQACCPRGSDVCKKECKTPSALASRAFPTPQMQDRTVLGIKLALKQVRCCLFAFGFFNSFVAI